MRSGRRLSSDPARFPGHNGKVYYSEGLDSGYRWYDAHGLTPLFPFGYGLSYTHFTLSGLRVTAAATGSIDPNTRPGQTVATVQATVTNTGARPGTEVAQLYLGDPATAGEPARQLKGFQPLKLPPGNTATVTLRLTARDLAYWNTTSNAWTISPGTYQVYLGTSSALANLPLRGSFRLG